MNPETLAVHGAHGADAATGAVALPIHLSTTFERAADGSLPHGYLYARDANPNRIALERVLAVLEKGAVAAAFASGQAATMAVFQSLSPGDHVVLPSSVYYGTKKLIDQVFARWGLTMTSVDMRDAELVAGALRKETRLVWVETPSNPLLAVADIARIATLAHSAGATCAVDNTWATPVGQNPIALGADLVMHSTTKYLGGHGDVMGGALVSRDDDELFQRIRTIQTAGGAIAAPFDSWLVVRGIKTLPHRVRAHSANAMAVAIFLEAHRGVEAVHYPGLASHPAHAVAARQMSMFGGMVSVQIRGGREASLQVKSRVKLFTRATSLGGPESLVEHRASVEAPGSGTPDNLLRLSIGLEHPDDLITDLDQALGG
ncbi:MAG TPA: aminotransferase class V-fold PLP-dependent enzyme [Gemmatimonadaceae bacterium]|nr:aminotransferase class V-fold PLP-dependent enzyme [Gemmatimonadaceae bacterium]